MTDKERLDAIGAVTMAWLFDANAPIRAHGPEFVLKTLSIIALASNDELDKTGVRTLAAVFLAKNPTLAARRSR